MTIEYKVIDPPAVEPVSLSELKTQCRMYADLTDDDAYIQSLGKAARQKLESVVCRSFITQTIEARLNGFSRHHWAGHDLAGSWRSPYGFPCQSRDDAIQLLYPPLQSVESITYVDGDGSTQTIDPGDYVVTPGTPGYVSPAVGKTWPSVLDRPGSVVITFKAGDGDDATAVDEMAKLVIKLSTALWYDQRLPIATGTVAKMPFALEALTDLLRWGCYP